MPQADSPDPSGDPGLETFPELSDVTGRILDDGSAPELSENVIPGNLDSGVLQEQRTSKPLNSLRHQLAVVVIVIIGFLGAMLILLVALIQQPETQTAIREIGTIVFPPLVTLAATSFAWFFASKDREPRD